MINLKPNNMSQKIKTPEEIKSDIEKYITKHKKDYELFREQQGWDKFSSFDFKMGVKSEASFNYWKDTGRMRDYWIEKMEAVLFDWEYDLDASEIYILKQFIESLKQKGE